MVTAKVPRTRPVHHILSVEAGTDAVDQGHGVHEAGRDNHEDGHRAGHGPGHGAGHGAGHERGPGAGANRVSTHHDRSHRQTADPALVIGADNHNYRPVC